MSKEKDSNATGTSIDVGGLMKFMNDMCGQFSRLSTQINDFKEKKESEIALLHDAIKEASVKLNFHEQRNLNSMMDIDGLLFDERKKFKDSVIDYINSLGIEIASSEIIDVFVYTKRQRNNERKILRVTFVHEFIKRRVMRDKIRQHKDTSTTVYFSHVLTQSNLAMLMEGKKLKKENRISNIKLLNDRLFVFPLCNGSKIPVASMDDLTQFEAGNLSAPFDVPMPPQENSLVVDDSKESKVDDNDGTKTMKGKQKKSKSSVKSNVDSISPSTSDNASKEKEKSSTSEGRTTRSKTKKLNLDEG